MFREKSSLMDADGLHRTLVRIAHEIVEKNKGMEDVKLIGIQRRGVPMARQIADAIEKFEGIRPDVGILDITFYRDDLSLRSTHPEVHSTDVPFAINGKTVVLIDDVLYTGRTVRAAIEAIMDMGRPEKIQLAVLVDRGHRELPFRPDFVGKNVPTSRMEMVNVELRPIDDQDRIILMERVQE